MMKNLLRPGAVLLVLAMLFMVGCTGGEPASQGGAASTASTAGEDLATAGDTGAAVRTDIVIGMSGDVTSMDPHEYSTGHDSTLLNQIYEPLWMLDSTTKANDYYLAESYEMSDDGLVCTIKLREGVTFQDGSPMTSEDVLFSYERCLTSPYRSWAMGSIDHFEAPDDYTFVIHFTMPDVVFLSHVGSMLIAPSDYFEEVGVEGVLAKPVGTGAYELVSYEEGYKIELKAYEGHWDGAPPIKNATYRIITDTDSMLLSMQSGDVDLVLTTFAPPASIDAALTSGKVPLEKVTYSLGMVYIAMLNTQSELWQNKALRQAVGYAIDREFYVASALGGLGEPAGDIAPPDTYASPHGMTKAPYTYNLEKAKALMAEAGYPDGFDAGEFRFINTYIPEAEIIQQNLAAIGITCELIPEDFNALIEHLADGNYSISWYVMSAIPEYSGIINSFKTGGWNPVFYNNPDFDAAMDEAALAFDIADRTAVYAQAVDMLSEDAPIIPLAFGNSIGLRNANLQADKMYMSVNFLIKTASWQA